MCVEGVVGVCVWRGWLECVCGGGGWSVCVCVCVCGWSVWVCVCGGGSWSVCVVGAGQLATSISHSPPLVRDWMIVTPSEIPERPFPSCSSCVYSFIDFQDVITMETVN